MRKAFEIGASGLSVYLFDLFVTMTFVDDVSSHNPIPNVHLGTECGKITDANESLIGRRVVHEEYFGTICYVGQLPNSKDIWLGIDWDDSSRGRHDGSYNGIRYFQSKSPTSGSFVKPSKLSLGTSLEEALVYRYALCASCQLGAQINSYSHKPEESVKKSLFHETNQAGRLDAYINDNFSSEDAEYSGDNGQVKSAIRIELYTTPAVNQSQKSSSHYNACGASIAKDRLNRLKSVSLSSIPVYRALYGTKTYDTNHQPEYAPLWPSTGGCLGQFLTSLTELEMINCLLSKWTEIAEICIQIPWLKCLNVSCNRIRLPVSLNEVSNKYDASGCLESRLLYDVDSHPLLSEKLCSSAFPHLSQLTLVRCSPLDWESIRRIICWMPCLQILSLAYNNLGNPSCDWEESAIKAFRRLSELDLTHISLTSAYQLFTLIGPSTDLNTLLLNCNEISELPDLCNVSEDICQKQVGSNNYNGKISWFQNLKMLGLKSNLFKDWKFANRLLHLSKLRHLMVSDCPVFEDCSPKETARQEVIARLPNIKMLDREEITPEERRGAEIDYLKRYGAEWLRITEMNQADGSIRVTASEEFHRSHPVFTRLCEKYGAPEIGETKLVTRSIKEGLISVTFVIQQGDSQKLNESSSQLPVSENNTTHKQIPSRMTINHLRMMTRRLFHLSPKTSFELYAQSKRGPDNTAVIPLDGDTREIGFYSLESGDLILVRLQ
uniref:Tubulin-specific chaperone E n=1 Tax=Trichobilharzia regenti TaxID=157069 RepID=A0AA85JYE5_TRIRE|nr:unnamed protein product [Trichobilharzia regenti]